MADADIGGLDELDDLEGFELLPEPRRRDRIKSLAKKALPVPLWVRTSDLPKRAASALVMLAVAGLGLSLGGIVWDAFIILVALICFAELARLVWRATRNPLGRVLGLLAGAGYIGVATAVLTGLGDFLLILALGVTIFTDTGAYFSGRTIGGPKIAPRISPSKTWAGLAGGMIASGAWVVGWVLAIDRGPAWLGPRFELGLNLNATNLLACIALGAGLAIIAQMGDFFESWLKRRAHMKDSSNLIPGHGGVFDRVDGLLPVTIAIAGLGAALV
ncbi:phosphatidate cytidylyltransferase [Erythrobacter arachoides]|uniref:Phosphatidate cytidylyltransferase n=1 Tax=Aurantiacibacter arachoides TaxID=1850444 RepID=A0A845A5S4_9SPHN|nr:phosphatidate cytidylyltransferase [Aurantiacibacter arachoides]MXO92909.1 phosphatidate cytidylyltransferase [Aurantiacibacter arachoides]GGD53521.1 hypothetical protein GCM10011411_11760 [Aurantiacibacter arachoides]